MGLGDGVVVGDGVGVVVGVALGPSLTSQFIVASLDRASQVLGGRKGLVESVKPKLVVAFGWRVPFHDSLPKVAAPFLWVALAFHAVTDFAHGSVTSQVESGVALVFRIATLTVRADPQSDWT